jgi:hypothetical protein
MAIEHHRLAERFLITFPTFCESISGEGLCAEDPIAETPRNERGAECYPPSYVNAQTQPLPTLCELCDSAFDNIWQNSATSPQPTTKNK